jgi:carbonic anhydrase
MELFDGQIMGGLLEKSLDTATVTEAGWVDIGKGPGSTAGRQIDWLEFKDARAAVVDDVRTIRTHPLVPSRIPIYGYIYNVTTGQLEEVPEATKIGAA